MYGLGGINPLAHLTKRRHGMASSKFGRLSKAFLGLTGSHCGPH
jgi:hypothetical protein